MIDIPSMHPPAYRALNWLEICLQLTLQWLVFSSKFLGLIMFTLLTDCAVSYDYASSVVKLRDKQETWLMFCEVYTVLFFFAEHLEVHVHFAEKIKLIRGARLIEITDIDDSVPNIRGCAFSGKSPQSKPGTTS